MIVLCMPSLLSDSSYHHVRLFIVLCVLFGLMGGVPLKKGGQVAGALPRPHAHFRTTHNPPGKFFLTQAQFDICKMICHTFCNANCYYLRPSNENEDY